MSYNPELLHLKNTSLLSKIKKPPGEKISHIKVQLIPVVCFRNETIKKPAFHQMDAGLNYFRQ
jgi:hypothetical protein